MKKLVEDFEENLHKFKLCSNTNKVECLHSVRRKLADKRLNFSQSYKVRANLAILDMFLLNYWKLIMVKLQLPVPESLHNWSNTMNKQKLYFASRRANKEYKINRMKQKHKKYVTNKENSTYTYKPKSKSNNNRDSNSGDKIGYTCTCGKTYYSSPWYDKHKENCISFQRQEQIRKVNLKDCYVLVPNITEFKESVEYSDFNAQEEILEDQNKDDIENKGEENSEDELIDNEPILQEQSMDALKCKSVLKNIFKA